jgi:hypothetical protein
MPNPNIALQDAADMLTKLDGRESEGSGELATVATALATVALAYEQQRTADALELANLIQARALGAFDSAEEYKATRDKIRELAGLPESKVN